MNPTKSVNWLRVVGPGILVAATGVGTGDLATGALTGSRLGVTVLWAVVVGAVLKCALNEGLARWQLATGDTLLEGVCQHFGRWVLGGFLLYLLFWSFFVGSALISACGVAGHALLPLGGPTVDKVIYGLIHSFVAVLLVRFGGYRVIERVMSVCIAVMFVTVLASAIVAQPQWGDVLAGLFIPRIPNRPDGSGLIWTVALMGGVGGTVTVLCYGYWIREEGRTKPDDLKTCRIDLAIGYAMTAFFGIAMVILGSTISIEKKPPAELIVILADRLGGHLGDYGSIGRATFLIGAWGAIVSSLLGVWQSVPYLFADTCRILRRQSEATDSGRVEAGSPAYRFYLYAIAVVPSVGLWFRFDDVQKYYAIVGAAFMPMLALALLQLNGREDRVGHAYRNSWLTSALLWATLALFALFGWQVIQSRLFG